MSELSADWLESVATLSWQEMGPAARILKYGASYTVETAWVKDARIEDGTVYLDVVLRLRPKREQIMVTVKVP